MKRLSAFLTICAFTSSLAVPEKAAAKEPPVTSTGSLLVINVKADGSTVVNRRTLSHSELSELLKNLLQLNSGQSVVIRAEATCAYNNIVNVLNTCREAGLTNVAFAVAGPQVSDQEKPSEKTFTIKNVPESSGPNKQGVGGFSGLDQLLARESPLLSETKIRIAEDQLFAFGTADLVPSDDLQKLVELLKRNPKATFLIESYSDSLGSDTYKLELSQRRADKIKAYLGERVRIDPTHLEAHGRGPTKFVVQPRPLAPNADQAAIGAEIRRESPNRRIEVTINISPR